jgi:hypothetical protein
MAIGLDSTTAFLGLPTSNQMNNGTINCLAPSFYMGLVGLGSYYLQNLNTGNQQRSHGSATITARPIS